MDSRRILGNRASLALVLLTMLLMLRPLSRAEDTDAQATPEPAAAEATIRQALNKPISLDLTNSPLGDAMSQLEEELGILIRFDHPGLDDLGIGEEDTVSLQVSNISARTALDLILRQLELVWTIRDEVLLVTIEAVTENLQQVKVYDVADLLESAEEGLAGQEYVGSPSDLDSLIALITCTIEPDSWDDVGGSGSIHELELAGVKALIVNHTPDIHEQTTRLLNDLRAGDDSATPLSEKSIRLALEKTVEVKCTKTPLHEAVQSLEDQVGVELVLDLKALGDVGIEARTPLSYNIAGVKLRSALDLMLRELNLTWAIFRDVLLITSPDANDVLIRTKVYDVADLPSFQSKKGAGVVDYDSLIEAITSSVGHGRWDGVGGPGSIRAYDGTGIQVLVVSQTYDLHEQIASLLADIREIRGPWATEEAIPNLPPPPKPISQGNVSYGLWRSPDGKLVCSGPVPRKSSSAPLQPDPQRDAVVQSNNRFALDLYAHLRKQTQGNLMFSPCSLSTALAMTYQGARGETSKQMAKTLHITLEKHELGPATRSLLAPLARFGANRCELRIANRLWGQRDYGFLNEFLVTTRANYGAELQEIDFRQPESARQMINAWIEGQTNGRITDLVGPGVFDEGVRLVLTNAIYFNADWARPFRATATHPKPFHSADRERDVPMMYQREELRYAATEHAQILEKPYAADNLSMVILLPKNEPDALDRLEAELTAEKLDAWLKSLSSQQVELHLPKFQFDTHFYLAETLESLGMPLALLPGAADFSGINGRKDLFLYEVIHKAHIEVHEQGTVAAAATGGGFFGGMPAIPVFRADHPFVFLIRENRTGCILFLGRVTDPPRATQPAMRGRGMF